MSLLKNTWKNKTLLFMCLPALTLLVLFNFVPLYGLTLAFKKFDYSLGFHSQWCGLDNILFLFKSKSSFIRITRNTILYFVAFTGIGTVCNVALAVAMHELSCKNLGKVCQSIMIVPTFISAMAVTYVVNALLDTSNGMLNQLLVALGQDPVRWYMEAKAWPLILILVKIWQGTGYGSVLYLSVLSGIDTSLYEAAELDGATKWQRIRYVTLPMLLPMVVTMTLLSVGSIMHSDTGLFYQVTKNTGALYSTTQVIDSYVLNSIMESSNFSMTAAVTLYQSLVGFLLVVIVNFVVKKINEDYALF